MNKLKEITKLEIIGIYRDVGLIAIDKKSSGTEIENIPIKFFGFKSK